MPRCRGTHALVREAVRTVFPRVVGVGLPHTGTTTLHSLLVLLGCCFATHNWPTGFQAKDSQALFRLCGNANVSLACKTALLAEASKWQCLTDNPWASHWHTLQQSAPTRTRFVLTRFADPLHYGVSRLLGGMSERRAREWALATWSPGNRVDTMLRTHARQYHDHVKTVRAALSHSPMYSEVCWACGDNATSLIRKLRLPAQETVPETPEHKSAGDERHRVGRLLREKVERSGVGCRGDSAWLCAP